MTDTQDAGVSRPARLDPYCRETLRFISITDTNALLSSIDNDCRKGYRSRLLRMSDSGAVVLYAADHVYWETYEHLPKFAKRSSVPLEVLRAHFENEYLPALRFVTVSDIDPLDSQVLGITDPDDVPTGILAKLIAPCLVFSDDNHLKKPGFAPKDWQKAAKSGLDVSEGASDQNTQAAVAVLPFRATYHLTRATSVKIGVSPWILAAMLLGAATYALWTPERRDKALKVAGAFVEAIGTELEKAMAQEERGAQIIREVLLPAPTAPTIRQQVAITLARQSEPLLAREIQEIIQFSFAPDTIPTVSEVRAVLEEGDEFVRSGRYRWQFGREAAPWSGTLSAE